MSTPELVTRVQEAFAKIPHDADCGDLLCDCGEFERHSKFIAEIDGLPSEEWVRRLTEWLKSDAGHTKTCRSVRYRGHCCSREARIAEAVARAIIEAARVVAPRPGTYEEFGIPAENAALGALGTSSQTETR